MQTQNLLSKKDVSCCKEFRAFESGKSPIHNISRLLPIFLLGLAFLAQPVYSQSTIILTGQGNDTTVPCGICLNGITVFHAPTATDNCYLPAVIHFVTDSTPGNCPQSYSITKKWYATDTCGNVSDTVTQTVHVVDNIPPVLTGQGRDTTVSCDDLIDFYSPSAHDNCDLNPVIHTVTVTIPGACPQSYKLEAKWWATDACGNVSDTATQTITVIDTTAPVLAGQGPNAIISCPTCHVCVPGFVSPYVRDACDLNPRITYVDSTIPGNCTNSYIQKRTWTATDACGNVSKPVSQTISVTDTIPPTVGGQGADKTIACTATPVFTSPTAHDNCDTMPILDSTTTRVNGSCPAAYTLTRHWWAVDACGNRSDTVSQTISVVDSTRPTVTGQGADTSVSCPQVAPPFHAPTATGGCDVGVTLDSTTTTGPGACPVTSTTTRSWWAVDACGNVSDTVSQTINLIDTTPPVAVCKSIIVGLVNDTATITAADVDGGSTDACSAVTVSINKSGFDCSNVGPNTVTLTVTDACGNSSSCNATVTITIPGPFISCKNDTISVHSGLTVCISALDVIDSVSATCGDSLYVNPSCFACGNAGNNTVTVYVKDMQGNIDSCSAIVYVHSIPTSVVACPTSQTLALECGRATLLPPSTAGMDTCTTFRNVLTKTQFTCADLGVNMDTLVILDTITGDTTVCMWTITVTDTVRIGAAGTNASISCTGTPVFTTPTTASCNRLDSSTVTTPGRCPESFSVTRSWWAVDSCGIVSDTVRQTITVTDNIPPTVSGQGANVTSSCTSITPVFTAPTAVDSCDPHPTLDSVTINIPGSCPGTYTLIRKWWAVDACGNISDTVSQTFSVMDTSAPVLSGQGPDTTLSCVDCLNGIPVFKAPTATADCDTMVTIHSVRDSIPGACPQSYTIIMKWWAVDACGNVSDTVSQSVQVIDNTPPTIFGQGSDTTISCEEVPTFYPPVAQDICDLNPVIAFTTDTIAGGCPQAYTVIRKWWATDACGNVSDTVSQSIMVVDTTAPVLSGQGGNTTVNCPSCTICIPGFVAPSAHDACDLNPRITYTDTTIPGACPSTYTITRTWTATDACGNVSTPVSETISVIDTTKPTISGQGANATIACTSTPVFTSPTTSDICASAMIDSVTVRVNGTCPEAYSLTRMWWAADACGLTSDTVSQTITVVDTTKPTISGQGPNTTVSCTATTPVFHAPTATGGCGATVSVDSTTTSTTGCTSTMTRSWWAVDACGNVSDTVSQTISITDSIRPRVSGQGANATISCTATPVFTAPITSAGCSATVTLDSATSTVPGSCPEAFSVTRMWWAVSSCGLNSDTVSQTITVIDTTKPTISGQGANTTVSCMATTPAFHAPTATGGCGATITIDSTTTSTTGCTSSTTRRWWAVDACGNISDTVSQTITVVDSIRPTVSGQGANATISCTSTPVFTAPTASASCSATVTLDSVSSRVAGSCPEAYSVTRMWWAVSSCGLNSDTVSQTITVIDTTKPTISGQGPNTTVSCTATPPVFHAPTATGGCGASVSIDSTTTSTTGCTSTTTRSWWAVDACGNISDTVSQTITITDSIRPTVSGQGADATISCTATPVFTAPTASASCSATVTLDSASSRVAGSCPEAFSVTRMWWAVSSCGLNSDTVSQTITVIDTTKPIISGQGANTTVSCMATTPAFRAPTATGGCGATVTIDSTTTSTTGCTSSTTRRWWAVDACGNVSDTVSQTITVVDSIRPTVSGQGANATISCTSTPVFTAPTASASCSATVTLDSVSSRVAGSCPEAYSVTRMWWAVSSCGLNSDTVSQTITVIDTTKPTISGQGPNTTVSCMATAPVFHAPTATGGCGASVTLDSTTTSTTGCTSTTTRSWWAVDACGNVSDTVSQTITVVDSIRPTVSGQGADATISCTSTPVFTAPTASASCSATVTLDSASSRVAGSCPEAFSITRMWWAVSSCGLNSDTVSQTITVIDTTKPAISGQGANTTVSCMATTPVFHAPTATGGCGASVRLDSTTTSTTGCTSTTTRRWWAVDACGNVSDTVSQTITVIDTTKPVLSGEGPDTTISCVDCLNGVPGFSKPTVTAGCGSVATISYADDTVAGACPQSFSVTRKWWAVDACGNRSDTVQQTVNVIDNTPPTLTDTVTSKTVSCDGDLSFTNPAVHDACDLNPTVYDTTITIAGGCPQSYTMIRRWWAIDHCGNISDTVSETISVIDTTPPVLSGQGANVFESCVVCNVCLPGFVSPAVTDACDLNPRVSYVDTITPGRCSSAYTITRTWTAVDACGNVSLPVSQTIRVEDTIPPVLACVPDTTLPCDSTPVFGIPTATDNCDSTPTVTIAHADVVVTNANGSTSYTRTWLATDACGNTDSCSQVVTISSCGPPPPGLPEPNVNHIIVKAYPNPSNSNVNLDLIFDQDKDKVSLKMFNLAGELIADLYDGPAIKNYKYHFVFETGTVASGIYFYSLNTDDDKQVGRVIISKE